MPHRMVFSGEVTLDHENLGFLITEADVSLFSSPSSKDDADDMTISEKAE